MAMNNEVKCLKGIELPFQNRHEKFDKFQPELNV